MIEMESGNSQFSEEAAGYREAIHRYILGIVHDSTEAEDLTQETLLRAYRKLSALQDHTRLAPWLYRIATNVCYDRFRQASYRHRPQSLERQGDDASHSDQPEAPVDDAPRLDKVMEQKEMSACVQRYMRQLSDSYRAVILLHDVQGLTNPEIAAMLEISLATVKIRLHRARDRLRTALEEGCSFSCDERGVVVCEPKPPENQD